MFRSTRPAGACCAPAQTRRRTNRPGHRIGLPRYGPLEWWWIRRSPPNGGSFSLDQMVSLSDHPPVIGPTCAASDSEKITERAGLASYYALAVLSRLFFAHPSTLSVLGASHRVINSSRKKSEFRPHNDPHLGPVQMDSLHDVCHCSVEPAASSCSAWGRLVHSWCSLQKM